MKYIVLGFLFLTSCGSKEVGTLACSTPVGLVETKTNDQRVTETALTYKFKGSQGTLEVPKAMCVTVYE